MAQHGFTPTLACTVVREDGSQTSRLLVNRQRQLLVCRQLAQLQSELAQLKTDESGLVAMTGAKPDAEPEPDAELYTQMHHMAEVPALAPSEPPLHPLAAVAHWCPAMRQLLVPGLEPRDFQLRAAAAAIRGRDIFVIESAGAGKTLAAWFAALILGGVTLFISPLIALAAEQAAKLNASNAGAVLLNGGEIATDIAWVVGGRKAQDFMGRPDGSVDPVTTRDALAKLLCSGEAEAIREGTDEEALLLRAKELKMDLTPAHMFVFTNPEKVALSASSARCSRSSTHSGPTTAGGSCVSVCWTRLTASTSTGTRSARATASWVACAAPFLTCRS